MSSKFFFTAALFLLIAAHSAQAKIWTVAQRPGANFSALSTAVGSASVLAGDTILVSGGSLSYVGFTISKRLTIIGPGYFLGENPGQADTNSARINSTVNVNAQGTILMGLYFASSIYVNADNVTISRCRMGTSGVGTYPLYVYAKDSVIIRQCYIHQASSYYGAVSVATGNTQFLLQNNYIEYAGGSSYTAIDFGASVTGDVSNNVITGDININTVSYNNNIQRSGTFNGNGSVTPLNNIGNGAQYPAGTNQQGVTMTTVFAPSGTSDSKWQIQTLGPADNPGFGGVDCGMFENGVGHGYVLSGIPSIPSIYLFNAAVGGSTITIDVNVKSNN